MYDLVIRRAMVVDGLGREPRRADVAVKDSRIAAIGAAGGDAAEVIDAGGLSLMPGIVDIHTHYDAISGPKSPKLAAWRLMARDMRRSTGSRRTGAKR